MIQVILGHIPAKSNNYIIVKINGKCTLAKSLELKAYERSFSMQCNVYRNKHIDALFDLIVTVYFRTKASDIDNSLKILLDCLQGCNAIKNDNLCARIEIIKKIDPKNPRIEFVITH